MEQWTESKGKAGVMAIGLDALLLLLGGWPPFSKRNESCLARSDLERYKQRGLRYFYFYGV